MNFVVVSSIGAVFMGIFALFVRMKAAKKPTNVKKIILPPVFMSSGALMYVVPQFRLTPLEIVEVVIVGMLFSILLIKTSKFEIRENEIYLKRSKAFMYILVGLLVVRLALKSILSTTIDFGELSGMFFLVAFSMIVPWRVAMYLDYKKLYKQLRS
ncbi:cytochrome c biogenesis protein CcdC [Bacillus sp. EB106-08-02-XG196]|jgi:membrane protein CcdC involved in cytochrome C biogenesis|uniref:CcdC family protein n=1 Tax=Bacillus sp. EB106-08-02-XG196 TaxID=2737049 RepID=UPI0015C46ED4|nr:cytochrome c biogenesis protein CcdC [Bacillus sp. EB106-08-02-XG196]NWQ40425.1 cytochrome c biogenesis protein CcdC [Bacillus sp. EB106-08-02-XG196]